MTSLNHIFLSKVISKPESDVFYTGYHLRGEFPLFSLSCKICPLRDIMDKIKSHRNGQLCQIYHSGYTIV